MSAPFGRGTATFFEVLEADNSRSTFVAHRDEYDTHVRGPLERLLGETTKRYGGAGHVSRPNRDLRFTPDRSPYRLDAFIAAGELAGPFLRVHRGGLQVGGGLYGPSRDQLERARTAIASVPRAAADLRQVVATLVRQGFELAGPDLKTAPRGYERDHPEIELLRMQHYAGLRDLPMTASTARIREAWRQVEPLTAWIVDRVGPPRPDERR